MKSGFDIGPVPFSAETTAHRVTKDDRTTQSSKSVQKETVLDYLTREIPEQPFAQKMRNFEQIVRL